MDSLEEEEEEEEEAMGEFIISTAYTVRGASAIRHLRSYVLIFSDRSCVTRAHRCPSSGGGGGLKLQHAPVLQHAMLRLSHATQLCPASFLALLQ